MTTSLRITSFIVFFIGAYLLIPKLVNGTQAFTSSNIRNSPSITKLSEVGDYQHPISATAEDSLNSDSEIPYFGAPNSQHGSGTR
jgi:hypothetical protein